MGFEIIEHTADVGLAIWAPDLRQLFVEAGRGLMAVMGRAEGEPAPVQDVDLSAPDTGALLVDWLSELLYLFEVRNLAFEEAELDLHEPSDPQADWKLHARATGRKATSLVQSGPAVKAITYHGLQVVQDASGVRARVYLDV